MRADRIRRGAVLSLVALLATSGCATIPSEGTPQEATTVSPLGTEPRDSSVRVFAEGPRDGDSVYQIVNGFLAASGTAEEGYRKATTFLTEGRAARWYPGARITVYDHNGARVRDVGDNVLEFTAPAVGSVDDQGVFSAAAPDAEVDAAFHLVKSSGRWRIDDLPPGLYMSQQDFQREYLSVNTYFYNRQPDSAVLVPDPLFLPKRGELATALMSALLRGPSRWLVSAVSSGIPRAAALEGQVRVTSGVATVPLRAGSVPDAGVDRENMLAQLVMTLTEAPGVSAIEVTADGAPVTLQDKSRLTREDVSFLLPADLRPPEPTSYFLRDGVAYTAGSPPHQGPFEADVKLSEIAVAPGGAIVAGISKDRTTVLTAPNNAPDSPEIRLEGENLRSLTFDQDGRLWVLDGEGPETVLRRLPKSGEAVTVTPRGFLASQVTRMRVAADGVRLAMVLDTREGAHVYLGVVTETGDGVVVGSVRRLGYGLIEPRDVAWAGPIRIVVLASEPNAQPQPYSVRVDNYSIGAADVLADIVSVAAAAGEPMLAGTSKNQLWRLDSTWTRVGTGTAPSYPG